VPTLRELQADILAALLGGAVEPAAAAVLPEGYTAEARLAIYRHHVLASLTDVLEATYPVVCRLVDRRFFGYAADQYIRRHPPASPCLFEYGGTFAEFLATFPPCQDLAYLPDVARLEWAMNLAEHAPDSAPADPAMLAGLDLADVPGARVTLDPSLTLLRSPWPVDAVWRANQPDRDARVDLATGPCFLEVRRGDPGVVCRRLGPVRWAFREALASGQTLEEAAARAFDLDPQLDLAGELGALLAERIPTAVRAAPAV
jgi:hypothetical protein